jgi:SCY1-like protein 1
VADAYALGLLLHSVFNPDLPPPLTASPPHPPPPPSSRGKIPTSVFPSYKRLLNPSPKARLSTKGFLETGMAGAGGEGVGFFLNNRLVKVCSGLDNFALTSESEKTSFLRHVRLNAGAFTEVITQTLGHLKSLFHLSRQNLHPTRCYHPLSRHLSTVVRRRRQ